ncbi:sigma-70 family RNA polymerase sigma factor [bacterium]|nr:sigma-70 family RNA polymerase sigma factor [bacterium]
MLTRINTWLGMAPKVETGTDELALCRRIAAGESHLFARIVDSYSSLVAGVISAQGVEASDVEDLAQLTFVNAYKGLGGFRGEAKLSSWIYRIAINVARQHLKRKASRPGSASIEEQAEVGVQPQDLRQSASAGHAQNTDLGRALKRLPELQRVALCLYYFEELSYEEIAEAMQLNLNTVRTHIRRGKLRLAEILDPALLDE